ncbi:unnamed protein product, partial [Ceratitis capitata]
MDVFDCADRYLEDGTPMVLIAGKDYGLQKDHCYWGSKQLLLSHTTWLANIPCKEVFRLVMNSIKMGEKFCAKSLLASGQTQYLIEWGDVAAQVPLQAPANEADLKDISRLPDCVKELRVFDGNPV